jgi:7,8-dihydropterin-6-yl-methyl-4-(beta-D-ribofuranosyl)aminobenzene 5'-phosphate synthase
MQAMKTVRFISILFVLILIGKELSGQTYEKLENSEGVKNISSGTGISSPVTFNVIYDNYVTKEGTVADWGFSVLISGLDKEVLFDTGTKPEIFESNIHNLGIDPSGIDILVLSHEHEDHTGGISSLVKMKTGIPVLLPYSFSPGFKQRMDNLRLKPVMVEAPSLICPNLYTSGEFDYEIPEEALVLDTKKGLVVLTGCAHPGIVSMLRKIKNDFGKNIFMVCGGFHLLDKSDEEMKTIISDMKKLGVVKCGATHCTGEKQIKLFKDAFNENYIELGTGNKIVIN